MVEVTGEQKRNLHILKATTTFNKGLIHPDHVTQAPALINWIRDNWLSWSKIPSTDEITGTSHSQQTHSMFLILAVFFPPSPLPVTNILRKQILKNFISQARFKQLRPSDTTQLTYNHRYTYKQRYLINSGKRSWLARRINYIPQDLLRTSTNNLIAETSTTHY